MKIKNIQDQPERTLTDGEALDEMVQWFVENTDNDPTYGPVWGEAADFIELAALLIEKTGRSLAGPGDAVWVKPLSVNDLDGRLRVMYAVVVGTDEVAQTVCIYPTREQAVDAATNL